MGNATACVHVLVSVIPKTGILEIAASIAGA